MDKTFYVALIVALAFVCVPFTASSQLLKATWEWMTPQPTGAKVTDVAFVDGTTALACGELNTLIRTNDGGTSWSSIANTYDILKITSDGSHRAWALTTSGELLHSDDVGNTWTNAATGLLCTQYGLTALGQRIIVSGVPDAAVYSTDAGNTWNAWVTPSLGQVVNVAIDGAGVFYVQNTQGQVYAFGDDGVTLKQYPAPYNGAFQTFTVSADGTLAMGTADKGIFTWSTADLFWQFSTLPLTQPVTALYSPAPSTFLAALSTGEILRSTDAGATFSTDTSFAPLRAFAFASNGSQGWICVGSDGLIAAAQSTAHTWSMPSARTLALITAVHQTGTGTLLAGDKDGVVLRKAPGSTTWTRLPSPLPYPITHITSADGGPLFMATRPSSPDNGLYTSTDDGMTWVKSTSPDLVGTASFDQLEAVSARCVYGVRQGQMFRTLDTGATWHAVPLIVDGVALSLGALFDGVSESVVWCTAYDDNNLYRTTTGGATWERVSHAGFGQPYFLSSASADSMCTGSTVSFNVTADAGATWSRTAETATPFDVAAVSAAGSYAVYSQQIVYVRRPTDVRWTQFDVPMLGLPQRLSAQKDIVWLDDQHLIVTAGYGGLLRIKLSTISSVAESATPVRFPLTVVAGRGAGYVSATLAEPVDVHLRDAAGRSLSTARLVPLAAGQSLELRGTPPPGLYTLTCSSDANSASVAMGSPMGYVILW